MGLIAELGRLAIGAWSPGGVGGGYIAAATYAANDAALSADPRLELVSLDIARAKLSVVAEVPAHERFTALDWSIPARQHPAGLIAGGLTDGTVRVWDAATLIRSTKSDDPHRSVVFGARSAPKKHSAAVHGLAFNPVHPTHLASGSADGTVLVWDLANPAAGPNVRHPAGKPPVSNAPRDHVTTVAWNRKVRHILGSGTSAGVMNVWDLKQSKQVISIRNPRGRLACSSLAWHPDIATQVIITCDDDESTGALMWDLRNASAPVMTFTHHSPKGVASSSWCNHDTDLLLTSSRDARTVVVSVSTGEIVAEAPQSANWNFDVKWSPRIPGLYLSSSFDGRLNVNSIMTSTTAPSVSSETVNALAESFGEMAGGFQSSAPVQSPRVTESQRVTYNTNRPPKWLKKPSSVSFGFGGLRASLTSKEGSSTVAIETVSEEFSALTDCSTKLDSMLMDLTSDDPSPAQKWCEDASSSAEIPKEKLAWDALGIMFQTDSRRKLLSYLGFEVPPKDAADDIAMPVYGLVNSLPLAVPVRSTPSAIVDPDVTENKTDAIHEGERIGNGAAGLKLDGPAPWEITDASGDSGNVKDSILDGDDTANGGNDVPSNKANGIGKTDGKGIAEISFAGKSQTQIDGVIKQAVIVGDFKTAVDACLHADRAADALVIAHAGGPDLWLHTQAEYLTKASLSSGSSIVGAVAGPRNKMDDYIRQSAEAGKETWKEALAVILTYTPAEELSEACTALGQRLLLKEDHASALFCFICGNNTRMAASAWMRERPSFSKATSVMMTDRLERLVALVQKCRMLTAATLLSQGEREIGAVRAMDEISGSVLCEFGALLASQGDLSLAITYLSNLDPSYSCVYGTAEDLQVKASESLAMAESVAIAPHQASDDAGGQGFGTYANAFDQSGYNYSDPASYQNTADQGYGTVPPPPPGGAWSTPAPPSIPSVPTPYGAGVGGMHSYPSPTPPAPAPAVASPPPPPAVYSSQAPTAERSAYDPSAAYAAAPSYDQSSYAPPPVPPPPNMGLVSSPTMSSQTAGGMPAATPPPPMPAAAPVAPPVQTAGIGYPPPSQAGLGGGYGMQSDALAPPPPPPPPPTDDSAPPPMPYHANARPGSGASLPPSAEVAVAATRRSKPLSSSGTPGGPPRRTGSTSSSLSALGIETVLLEKAEVNKVPADQQVIVKSLRGSYMYARSRSDAPRYKKKLDDVSKRLGRLVAALNNGLLEPAVVDLLMTFAKAVEKGNYDEASAVVSALTKQHWDSNSQWIQGLKRLIDCVLTGR